MTHWVIAGRERPCGQCGAPIPAGTAALVYHLLGVTRALVRCASCAGEPVPAVVPSAPPPRPQTPLGPRPEPPLTPAGRFERASLRRDFKQRQTGSDR